MRLIVFGHNDWWTWERQGFCGRNAALVRELARRDVVERVVVVDSPRFAARASRPPDRRHEDASEVAPKIVAVRHDYPLPLPARWSLVRRLDDMLTGRRLRRRVAAAVGAGGEVVLWIADPRLVEPALRLPHDLLVFDAIDDWRHHRWAGVRTVARGYRRAARSADLMLAVNDYLLSLLAPSCRAVALPNALDWAEWETLRPDAKALTGLRRPLVGQVGSLQERVDVALLAEVARVLADFDFAVIGPTLHGYALPADLPANVRLLGPLPHDRIPDTLAAMDACVMLHHRDGIQRSMDPLKLYEYLAAGRPVVSTIASPNPRLAAYVRVATTADDIAAALVEEIGGDDGSRRAARRAAVKGETWSARADEVLSLLAEAMPAASGAG